MDKSVVELFAGVGGFRIGLNDVQKFDDNGKAIENRDWNFVWMNQWEPSTNVQDAFICYATRFNECDDDFRNCNISEVPSASIPMHSLLVGGFPCQDYSVARGLSGEKGIHGVKGVLFWEIKRIVEEKNTPFVLLENVDRLLKSPASQRGRDFGIMLRTFHDLGYNVEWRVINAAEYGCAQRRRRIFIFAWKNHLKYSDRIKDVSEFLVRDSLFAKSFPIKEDEFKIKKLEKNILDYIDTVEMTDKFQANFEKSGIMLDGEIFTQKYVPVITKPINLRDILEKDRMLDEYCLNTHQIEKMKACKNSKKIKRTNPAGKEYTFSEGTLCFPDNLDIPGRTMLTSEASINRSTHVIQDPATQKFRFLTQVEAERLQGFPDDWTDTGMNQRKRYFMMGNALVTKIVNMLEYELSIIIENE